jgi:hypothetical protein
MNVGINVLHGIIHSHAGSDNPARTVDVHIHRLFGSFSLEEEELGRDNAGHLVCDGTVDADDALAEETGVDVEGSFAGHAVLEDYRHKV